MVSGVLRRRERGGAVSNHVARPRPRRDPRAAITDVLGPLDGGRIPGGCDSCDAYQTPRQLAVGVWQVDVYHDRWCPVLAQAGAGR